VIVRLGLMLRKERQEGPKKEKSKEKTIVFFFYLRFSHHLIISTAVSAQIA
jgi:hypothetical protein